MLALEGALSGVTAGKVGLLQACCIRAVAAALVTLGAAVAARCTDQPSPAALAVAEAALC